MVCFIWQCPINDLLETARSRGIYQTMSKSAFLTVSVSCGCGHRSAEVGVVCPEYPIYLTFFEAQYLNVVVIIVVCKSRSMNKSLLCF